MWQCCHFQWHFCISPCWSVEIRDLEACELVKYGAFDGLSAPGADAWLTGWYPDDRESPQPLWSDSRWPVNRYSSYLCHTCSGSNTSVKLFYASRLLTVRLTLTSRLSLDKIMLVCLSDLHLRDGAKTCLKHKKKVWQKDLQ